MLVGISLINLRVVHLLCVYCHVSSLMKYIFKSFAPVGLFFLLNHKFLYILYTSSFLDTSIVNIESIDQFGIE